jgi:hypothetical protein
MDVLSPRLFSEISAKSPFQVSPDGETTDLPKQNFSRESKGTMIQHIRSVKSISSLFSLNLYLKRRLFQKSKRTKRKGKPLVL